MFEDIFYNGTPKAFYGYTSIVHDRIMSTDYYSNQEIKELQNELIKWFNEQGIKACYDNKIVFEVDINGKSIFIGFKDWKCSIGFSVHSDSWIKPITKTL
jgi:hypothetical protein